MTLLEADPMTHRWIRVCRFRDLLPERGAAVLLETGEQVAIFRTYDGGLYAISNRDPFSGAQVLSRGIVGTREGAPTVASPMHKQVFDLRTGVCLDDHADPDIRVAVFEVRVRDGDVEVAT
jgi:nitrite reductase (NADH) small subunit